MPLSESAPKPDTLSLEDESILVTTADYYISRTGGRPWHAYPGHTFKILNVEGDKATVLINGKYPKLIPVNAFQEGPFKMEERVAGSELDENADIGRLHELTGRDAVTRRTDIGAAKQALGTKAQKILSKLPN